MGGQWIPDPGKVGANDPHFAAKVLAFRYVVYQHDDYLDWSTHECECMAKCVAGLAKENNELRAKLAKLEGGE